MAHSVSHAALSWAIDRWARNKLSPASRRRVEEARRAALAELVKLPANPPSALVEAAGVPDAEAHRALVEGFGAASSG